MRHVSVGMKRPSYFATTRTHGGNLPRKSRDARFPATPNVVLAQAAATRHVACARPSPAVQGARVPARPFGARHRTAKPEVARSDSETRVRAA
jgi:hypothetical protein